MHQDCGWKTWEEWGFKMIQFTCANNIHQKTNKQPHPMLGYLFGVQLTLQGGKEALTDAAVPVAVPE